jgi:hypothetical protein
MTAVGARVGSGSSSSSRRQAVSINKKIRAKRQIELRMVSPNAMRVIGPHDPSNSCILQHDLYHELRAEESCMSGYSSTIGQRFGKQVVK